MEQKNWGRTLRAFRKLKRYTQIDLAKKMGISVSTLAAIEQERRLLDIPNRNRAAEVLQIPCEEFISKQNRDTYFLTREHFVQRMREIYAENRKHRDEKSSRISSDGWRV